MKNNIFDVAIKINKMLKDEDICFAFGASICLYLNGMDVEPRDIDIVVKSADIEKTRQIFSQFEEKPAKKSPVYLSKHFYQYVAFGVDIDLMSKFIIKKGELIYEYPFDESRVERKIFRGQELAVSPVKDWKHLYSLMPNREHKVKIIEDWEREMSMKTNTYTDSLGTVEVASDKLWGASTQRSLNNFKISNDVMPHEIINSYGIIKKSAAKANCELGVLSEEKCEAICEVCDKILSGALYEHFPLKIWQTGSGTHTNMNANEVIANYSRKVLGVSLHPNDDVNMSQSSNDTFPTAIKIASYKALRENLIPAIEEAEKTLLKLSEKFFPIIKSGRTHLMDAAPLRLGQEFSAYYEMLRKSKQMIELNSKNLLELPLGGTAVGTGLNSPKGYQEKVVSIIKEESGYDFYPARNNFHGLSSMDFLVNLFGSLKSLATDLIKIANDLRLLSSGPNTSIAEIKIPANEPGSSIMPGKINPTQVEAMIMICYQVIGYDTTVGLCAMSGILELNVCQPLAANSTLKCIELLSDGLRSFNKNCLVGIEPNVEKIKKNLNANAMLVTSLNKLIGYDKASEIAKKAVKEGISIRQSALSLGYIGEEDFDKTVDPEKMCEPNK